MDSGNSVKTGKSGKSKSKEHETVSRPPGFHPPTSNTEIKHHRAYAFHQLLTIRDLASVQQFSGSLPSEIDRKKLSGLARKRRYPFVSDPRYRKGNGSSSSSQSSSQNRWNEKNGGPQWRNKQKNQPSSVVRSDPIPLSDQNEDEIHEDITEPHSDENEDKGDDETTPLWAQDNDNEIKSKPFVFKLLDREKDREVFVKKGQVPDEPTFVSREELETEKKQEAVNNEESQENVKEVKEFGDASNISELFRAASQGDSLPQMPQSAIAHDILEKKTVANTALQETRHYPNNHMAQYKNDYGLDQHQMGDYSQFAFGSDRLDNRGQPKKQNNRDPQQPPSQQQRGDPQQKMPQKQGAGAHPQDDLVYRGRLPPRKTSGGGHVQMPPPNEPQHPPPPRGVGGRGDGLPNNDMEKYLRDRSLHDAGGRRDPHHDPRGMPRDYEDMRGMESKDRSRQTGGRSISPNPNYPPQQQSRNINNTNNGSGPGPSKYNGSGGNVMATFTSSQKLDTILFEITVPVRPCIGGHFFAPARPLSNKELYDFSPKYREIHDSRQRAKAQEIERRRNEAKHFHQSKQMYERYDGGRNAVPPSHRDRVIPDSYHRQKNVEHDYGHNMVKRRPHYFPEQR